MGPRRSFIHEFSDMCTISFLLAVARTRWGSKYPSIHHRLPCVFHFHHPLAVDPSNEDFGSHIFHICQAPLPKHHLKTTLPKHHHKASPQNTTPKHRPKTPSQNTQNITPKYHLKTSLCPTKAKPIPPSSHSSSHQAKATRVQNAPIFRHFNISTFQHFNLLPSTLLPFYPSNLPTFQPSNLPTFQPSKRNPLSSLNSI
jgi:hypothetical protein